MRIAITGSIGSGKSEVGKILFNLGYPVIDTDVLAAEVLQRGSIVYGLLVEEFGDEILDSQGNVSKPFLANLIFTNPHEKERIEAMMHPEIWRKVEMNCAKYQDDELVFVEVPLLFETNTQGLFDRTVVVLAEQEIAIERLMTYRKIDRDEAYRRWETQMDPAMKMELADDVIFNNTSMDELEICVKEYAKKLETLR
jgi:dephospho-CoA kinase